MTTTLPTLLAAAGIGIGHAVLPDHWMPLAVLARTRRYPTRRVVRLSAAAAATHVVVSAVLGAVLLVVGLQFRDTVARHTDLAVGGVLVATGVVFGVLELLGRGHGHSHAHGGHDHLHQHSHPHGDHSHEGGLDVQTSAVAVLERTTVVATEIAGHEHHDHDHVHEGIVAVLERPVVVTTDTEERGHSHDHRGSRGLLAVLIPFGAAASPDLTILPVFLAAGALGVGSSVAVLAAFTFATVATIVGLTTATSLGARRLTAPWIERRANLVTAATLILIGGLVVTGLI